MEKTLPLIPAKRYFTIGEVSDLCLVKPYVLRYWEQEFAQLKPMKRRGNRRYYQHHEVLLVRRIRELLYDQGFTISGARNRLAELSNTSRPDELSDDSQVMPMALAALEMDGITQSNAEACVGTSHILDRSPLSLEQFRDELLAIKNMLET